MVADLFAIGRATAFDGPRAENADYESCSGPASRGIRAIYQEIDEVEQETPRTVVRARTIRVLRADLAQPAGKDDEIVLNPGTAGARRFAVLRKPVDEEDTMRLDWILAVKEITL